MSTTVKELSQKLNIKRNSVEMRMNQIPDFRKKYVTHKGNKLIISDKGGELICKLHPKRTVNNNVNMTVNDTVNDYKIDSLTKQLKQEQSHNSQLQKQLDITNASNKHLGKLLDQQQHLQLAGQGEAHRLRGQIKHLKAVSGPVDKSTQYTVNNPKKSENSSKKSKTSFWQRFFGKL